MVRRKCARSPTLEDILSGNREDSQSATTEDILKSALLHKKGTQAATRLQKPLENSSHSAFRLIWVKTKQKPTFSVQARRFQTRSSGHSQFKSSQ